MRKVGIPLKTAEAHQHPFHISLPCISKVAWHSRCLLLPERHPPLSYLLRWSQRKEKTTRWVTAGNLHGWIASHPSTHQTQETKSLPGSQKQLLRCWETLLHPHVLSAWPVDTACAKRLARMPRSNLVAEACTLSILYSDKIRQNTLRTRCDLTALFFLNYGITK